MKFFGSLFLSLLIFLPSLGSGIDWCCELPKVDNLLEHFQKHNKEEGISFLQFLDKHYGTTPNDDGDNHEDLPFHGNHSCNHIHLVITTPEFTYFFSPIPQVSESPSFYSLEPKSEFSYSIFQPPRQV